MEKERKGEIALILFKHRVSREGIRFSSLKRELGNLSKETKVPMEELREFASILFEEFLQETLGGSENNPSTIGFKNTT